MDKFSNGALVQDVDVTVVGSDMLELSWNDQYRLMSSTVIPARSSWCLTNQRQRVVQSLDHSYPLNER